MERKKQNSGPRITLYESKPKSRSTANKVWTTAHSVYGQPPSWMRMIPARRWFVNLKGEKEFANTCRWEISFDEHGDDPLVLNGSAKVVVSMLEGVK